MEPTPHTNSRRPLDVLIAGGGIAAMEALLALRALAEDRVRITVLAPNRTFVYPAFSVGGPFALGATPRYELAEIAADQGAELVAGSLAEVHVPTRTAVTDGGERLRFDALLVAIGAERREAIPGALTFAGRSEDQAAMRGILEALRADRVRRIAFVVPERGGWALPAYELALMTAMFADKHEIAGAKVLLVTDEGRALEAFGDEASAEAADVLSRRGVEFRGGRAPRSFALGTLEIDGGNIDVDRVVALPRLVTPVIPGLTQNPRGFIAVDGHARVRGLDGVYAAGDMTDGPIKQGGLAAQQADAAAQMIAAGAGAPVQPVPCQAVLRGLLLTGSSPLFMRADRTDGLPRESTASREPMWWPQSKVTGQYLAPYLAGHHRVIPDPGASEGVRFAPGELEPARPLATGRTRTGLR